MEAQVKVWVMLFFVAVTSGCRPASPPAPLAAAPAAAVPVAPSTSVVTSNSPAAEPEPEAIEIALTPLAKMRVERDEAFAFFAGGSKNIGRWSTEIDGPGLKNSRFEKEQRELLAMGDRAVSLDQRIRDLEQKQRELPPPELHPYRISKNPAEAREQRLQLAIMKYRFHQDASNALAQGWLSVGMDSQDILVCRGWPQRIGQSHNERGYSVTLRYADGTEYTLDGDYLFHIRVTSPSKP